MKRKRNILLGVLAVLTLLVALGFYNELKIPHYSIQTDKIEEKIRIALITDLHSCNYGENQKELVDALKKEQPDLVLLGGDIFDEKIPDDNAILLLEEIADTYPCYFVTGNHEYWHGKKSVDERNEILNRYGVTRLSGETSLITIRNEKINLSGIDDPLGFRVSNGISGPKASSITEQLHTISSQIDEQYYSVLLAHRPESFELYAEEGFDLSLCGHAHGGQWRIPLLLNGVYAPNQGFFPKYAGGLYKIGDSLMLVGRGLARETTKIPRIFNRPELVIIDLE